MAFDVDAFLGKLGGMLSQGFGDRVFIGFLFKLMDNIKPYQCYEFIRDSKDLFPDVTDEQWGKYAKYARQANLGEIDKARLVKEFTKYRPDLLSVMINHPNGEIWLDHQVARLKAKLNLT